MTSTPWGYHYVVPRKKRKKQKRTIAKRDDTKGRVCHIHAMILNGTFLGRKSVLALAEEWGVSETRVDQLVAEVKRWL